MTKRKPSIQPLVAKENAGWLDKSVIDPQRREKLNTYAMRFLFECEAYGTSLRTNGFITDFSLYTTQRVRSFSESLCLNSTVEFVCVSSAGELAAHLVNDGLSNDDFTCIDSQFAYMTFAGMNDLSKKIKELKEFKKGEKKKQGKAKQNKSEFYRFDCLLRHLRNSIAHGQCQPFRFQDGSWAWAFQDSNTKGNITSRMLLKEDTLDSWAGYFTQHDRRYR